MTKKLIGITDSGVGGITTLTEIYKLLPSCDYIYFADKANAPYGDKSEEFLTRRMEYITAKFFDMNVQAVVIACNTATNVCIEWLRERFWGRVIIGVEPAVKPAAAAGGRTAVLVTPLTATQPKFISLMKGFGKNADVFPLKGMASLIENNIGDLSAAISRTSWDTTALNGYDNVVLGCTHYIYLRQFIEKAYPRIRVFDGNAGVAKRLYDVMGQQNSSRRGSIKFLSEI